MSEVNRLYEYKSLLGGRKAVSARDLMSRLEISPATLKRDIAKLRDQLHVPIRFDRDRGGYVIDPTEAGSELPGLWFNPQEILALVTIQHLMAQLAPGLLGPKLKPMQERLAQLMARHGLTGEDIAQRIRVVHAGRRSVQPQFFEAVANATLARKRLKITHFNRQNGQSLEREISPQRLVHYRDNWYVDAWCHLRDDVRSFSVDAMTGVHVLEAVARDVDPGQLDGAVAAGYGIFAGTPRARAVLRFTPQRARWVRGEEWHPLQVVHDEPDGSYVLSVPYSDERELIGDILRFGADVQVLEPPDLKAKVQAALLESVKRYL